MALKQRLKPPQLARRQIITIAKGKPLISVQYKSRRRSWTRSQLDEMEHG